MPKPPYKQGCKVTKVENPEFPENVKHMQRALNGYIVSLAHHNWCVMVSPKNHPLTSFLSAFKTMPYKMYMCHVDI